MSQHDDTTRIETLLEESDETTRRTGETSAEASAADGTTERASDSATERPVESSGDRTAEHTTQRPDLATSTDQPATAAGASASAPGSPYAAHTYQGQTAVPEFKSGPAPTTSVVGLLGLLTVIAVLVAQATDLDVAWNVVGPVAVVGAGVLLVVLGLAGLRGQRFRG